MAPPKRVINRVSVSCQARLSGVAASAAADGVGARRSATKSAIVTSTSWPTPQIVAHPRHPYTRSLLDAARSVTSITAALTAQDAHKPKGKYTVLTTIAEKYTTNPGHPGNSTPVMDEIYNTFLIPQMFAEVAQGKSTPAEAVSAFAGKAQAICRSKRSCTPISRSA